MYTNKIATVFQESYQKSISFLASPPSSDHQSEHFYPLKLYMCLFVFCNNKEGKSSEIIIEPGLRLFILLVDEQK